MKRFKIKIPIYNVSLTVIQDDDTLNIDEVGRLEDNSMGTYILKIKKKNKVDCIGIIAHEVQHFVARVLRRAGLPLCEESEEAYCYLTGYVTREIYKKL